MSKKIYLSPSNQCDNRYATGNTTEMIQCNRICNALKTALERNGFNVKKAAEGQPMRTSISESNSYKPDLHLCVHTNAGGGNGTMVMVYNKGTANMRLANPIYKHTQAVTPGKIDYGIREYPDLAELNSTNATAVYIEVDFHDNRSIAQWIINNTTTIAEAVCKGICEGFGVTYKASNSTKTTSTTAAAKTLYRVQVGTFSDKRNADIYLKKVKSAGFRDAYIVEVKK